MSGGASAGTTAFSVAEGSHFAAGDEVLVLSQRGGDAGQYQFVFIAEISDNVLTIEPPLTHTYSSSSIVLVQRVPHYQSVNIRSNGVLNASEWGGAGGGVIVFRATGDVNIEGTVTSEAQGYRGGAALTGNGNSPFQGESHTGVGQRGNTSANAGGGGAYPTRGDHGDSGGGGGYGSAGSVGIEYSGNTVTSGGSVYGTPELTSWFVGSGGGAGSPDAEGDGSSSNNITGAGGDGGGLIAIFCGASLTISGIINANGQNGSPATSAGGELGGGGAGSGGQIYLTAPTINIQGLATATGGSGGLSAWHDGRPYGSGVGGRGGNGRIRLDYTNLSGSTSPAPGHQGSWQE